MTTAELLRPLLEGAIVRDRSELVEALLVLERRGCVASTYGPGSELAFVITSEGTAALRAGELTRVQTAVLDVLQQGSGKPARRNRRKPKR